MTRRTLWARVARVSCIAQRRRTLLLLSMSSATEAETIRIAGSLAELWQNKEASRIADAAERAVRAACWAAVE